MRCLITGASGFLGANLVEAAVQRGYVVRGMHRKSSNLQALAGLTYESALGDITEPDSLDTACRGIDIVFHVAAVATYWKTNVQTMYAANVQGTRNVLQAAKKNKVQRVVFVSSVAALGVPPFGKTLDENAQFNLRPEQFHYGYSKHLAEQVAQEFVRDGLPVVIVNPAIIMGARDVNLIGGNLVVQMAKTNIFYYPSGGSCQIDAADVCAAMLNAVERGRSGERYILGGENLWHTDTFGIAAQVAGKPRPWLRVPRGVLRASAGAVDWARAHLKLDLPVDGQQTRFSAETFWFDSAKARRKLGLTPRPFVETVQRTYAWYKQHGYI